MFIALDDKFIFSALQYISYQAVLALAGCFLYNLLQEFCPHDKHFQRNIAFSSNCRCNQNFLDSMIFIHTNDIGRRILFLAVKALGIDDGNICFCINMLLQSGIEVNVGYHIAVGKYNIFRLGMFNELPNIVQRFQSALINTAANVAERWEQMQTAGFTSQVPFSARAQMIQQRTVVGLCDNTHF